VTLKARLLQWHRWLALAFALPLAIVIVTGLILSFEPLAQQRALPQPLTSAQVMALLERHDPAGSATSLFLRRYDNQLALGPVLIDLGTGEAAQPGWTWSALLRTSRGLHEHLLLGQSWIVIASTVAMLGLLGLGVAMGWPRPRNTLGGWHNMAAWITLPLGLLVPLTGLALSFGIGVPGFGQAPAGPPVPLRQAVEMVLRLHPAEDIVAIRRRGPRQFATVYEQQQLRAYVVEPAGLRPIPTNWPRALHEGNWHASIGSAANLLASVVFSGLWLTGLLIWLRRKTRRRQRQRTA
jgi:uncharacterized iron-regulated membrane protein